MIIASGCISMAFLSSSPTSSSLSLSFLFSCSLWLCHLYSIVCPLVYTLATVQCIHFSLKPLTAVCSFSLVSLSLTSPLCQAPALFFRLGRRPSSLVVTSARAYSYSYSQSYLHSHPRLSNYRISIMSSSEDDTPLMKANGRSNGRFPDYVSSGISHPFTSWLRVTSPFHSHMYYLAFVLFSPAFLHVLLIY